MKSRFFCFLLSVYLVGCAHQHQGGQSASGRWPFTVHGQLADADIVEILAVVHRIPNFDKRVVRIEANTPGSVSVYTGEMRGFLDGGGNVVTLEKKKGRWSVVGDWRESIWVS